MRQAPMVRLGEVKRRHPDKIDHSEEARTNEEAA